MAALKWLVGVMGVLIVAGTVTLVVLIVQRAGGDRGAAVSGAQHLGQPAGTRILSVAETEGRLVVLVARPDGERILFVEPRRGRVIAELRAAE
ncbi:DUF6476 family protein [Falsiroseomonas oryziterrae]|uniref:DUF6476 family protein n=1 Tax=Falsiroseomonas oryziterrae TaxID=2911368 RepID=UPI001F1F9C46|nr:DUF6476 family protein [Roseomonas sp. NPKOSM-4]